MYGDTEFQKCIYLYASNKGLPPIAAGSKARLKFIAARTLIRSFTVIVGEIFCSELQSKSIRVVAVSEHAITQS